MDEAFRALVCGLAAWRLGSLLAFENGPWNLLEYVRRYMFGFPDSGEITGVRALLITCLWCSTVWFAPLFWIAWEWHPWIPGVFAAMAIAVACETFITGRGRH